MRSEREACCGHPLHVHERVAFPRFVVILCGPCGTEEGPCAERIVPLRGP